MVPGVHFQPATCLPASVGIPAMAVPKAVSMYGVSVNVFASMVASPTLAIVTVTVPTASVSIFATYRDVAVALSHPHPLAAIAEAAVDAD